MRSRPACTRTVQLRTQLKKAHGVDPDTVECVFSSEEQVAEMLPLSKEQEKNPEDFGVVDNFRYAAGNRASDARAARCCCVPVLAFEIHIFVIAGI